jgi:hypothetical protein
MSNTTYVPLNGFYDLRAFKIPRKQFKQLWNIQKFLYGVETQRRAGNIHPQINEIRQFSADYQQVLFQYPVIKPELI